MTNKDLLEKLELMRNRVGLEDIGDELKITQPVMPTMNLGHKFTREDEHARGVYSGISDLVVPKRIDDPLETAGIDLSDYVEFKDIDTPSAPLIGELKLYYDSTGSISGLYTLDSNGDIHEILTNYIDEDVYISSTTVGSLDINGVGNATEYSKLSLTANSGNSWIWRHEEDNDLKLRHYDGSSTKNIMQITSTGKVRILEDNLDISNGKYIKIWDINNKNAGQIEHMGWGMTLSVGYGDIGLWTEDYINLMNGNTRIFGKMNYQPEEVTITAGGEITPVNTYLKVETNGGGATDNLDTINGGEEGDILILQAVDSTHTVVVKNGTGNIKCGADFSLDHATDKIMLIFNGLTWDEVPGNNA